MASVLCHPKVQIIKRNENELLKFVRYLINSHGRLENFRNFIKSLSKFFDNFDKNSSILYITLF